MDVICKLDLWKNVSLHQNFLCTAGNNGFRKLLQVNFVQTKLNLH